MAQVHEMQKMESLGQLTGGVAHDFNNLLMVILGNLQLLRKRVPDEPRFIRLIDGAMQGADRGATLTKRMLAFARRQELKPETVDVMRLVSGMEEMLRRTLGPTIQISIDFHHDLPAIRVDPNQLELALLNLALNARDAMPLGGRLGIAAERKSSRGGPAGLAAGDFVCVSVTDSGTGMDEHDGEAGDRTVLHHQGRGQGYRSRPVHGGWACGTIGRRHADRQQDRHRHDRGIMAAGVGARTGGGAGIRNGDCRHRPLLPDHGGG